MPSPLHEPATPRGYALTMKPHLSAFLLTFLFANLPAVQVSGMNVGTYGGFVVGSAAVAALVTIAALRARRARWYGHALLLALTCAVAPFVAGGVTGAAIGLLDRGTLQGALDLGGTGLFGASLIFPFLAGATLLAWGVALLAGWANDRWASRAHGVGAA